MSESNRPVLRYKPGYAKAKREAIRSANVTKFGAGTLSVSDDGVNWRKVADVSSFEFRPSSRKNRRGCNAEDNSPYDVRRMRAALCDEFIATGVMNEELMAKLRAYAESKREGRVDARRRSKNDPVGVQTQPSLAIHTRRDDL